MLGDIDLTSTAWCDIVFEGKNQSYGAYYLRRTSSRRHFRSLLIILAVCVVLVFLPTLIKQVVPERTKISTITETVTMVDLEGMMEPEEEIEQVAQVEAPPPPALKETIRFAPPVIDASATDEDIMRTQDVVSQSKALIFTEDIAGSNRADAVDPATLVKVVQEVVPPAPPQKDKMEILEYAEVMPSYPGGDAEMFRVMGEMTRYPLVAQEHGIQGRVILRFAVMEDGSISRVSVLRSIHPSLDAEAIRVIKAMGRWIPGQQNGRNVPVYFKIPVTFHLEQR